MLLSAEQGHRDPSPHRSRRQATVQVRGRTNSYFYFEMCLGELVQINETGPDLFRCYLLVGATQLVTKSTNFFVVETISGVVKDGHRKFIEAKDKLMLKSNRHRRAELATLLVALFSASASNAMAGEPKWEKRHPRRDQANDRPSHRSQRIAQEREENGSAKDQAIATREEDRQVRREHTVSKHIGN